MGRKAASRPVARIHGPAAHAAAPARTSVADALFTATQQRVLSLLFGCALADGHGGLVHRKGVAHGSATGKESAGSLRPGRFAD